MLTTEQIAQARAEKRHETRLSEAIEARNWGQASNHCDTLRMCHGWTHRRFVEKFGESWNEYAEEMDEADSRGES